MTEERLAEITKDMRLVPIMWALRWCGRVGECACQGCTANNVRQMGGTISKDEWLEWWATQVSKLRDAEEPAFPFRTTDTA